MGGVSRIHVACLVLVGVGLPAASRVAGSETFAYAMFAGTTTYSIDIVAADRAGRSERVSPSTLASALPAAARPFVSGAETDRRARSVSVLRSHLRDLARVACGEIPTAARVDVTLFEHRDDAAPATPPTRTEAHVECP
jgi:hypothetical protein